MSKVRVGIGVLVSCVAAWALVTAYHVEPKTAAMSGWTRVPPHPSYYVSEVITCNWDELDSAAGGYVELFVGPCAPGAAA